MKAQKHERTKRRLQAPRLLAAAARPSLGRQAWRLMPTRAVVLLSGGLDSATTPAVAREEGYECFALSFDYGQRHARELESASKGAVAGGVIQHLTLRLDFRAIGGSALTDDIAVPKGRREDAVGAGMPVTYVRARAQHHLPQSRARLGRGAGFTGHLHRRERAGRKAAIPTVGPSSSRRSKHWRISRPGPASKVQAASVSTRRSSRSARLRSSPGPTSWASTSR